MFFRIRLLVPTFLREENNFFFRELLFRKIKQFLIKKIYSFPPKRYFDSWFLSL